MTINEPVVYVFKSYFIGDWPPGVRSYEKCVRVLIHFLKAHVLAYDAMHLAAKRSGSQIQIGIAKHAAVFAPCSKRSWKDRFSVWIRNRLFNHLFVEALIRGRAFFPGLFNVRLTRAKTLDFIGLNYYTRHFVQNAGFKVPEIFGEICTLKHHRDVGKRNFLDWEIYPDGLYQLAKAYARHRLPTLISENGICTHRDEERAQFIKDHLDQAAKCLEEKIPIIGYLYWSLLDNYEWADGYRPRFGLVEVDYKTQTRTVRPSALQFAEICRTGLLRGAEPRA
jgi:beta-glucosidase